MLRATWTTGRRGAPPGASAAVVVCLGGTLALAACGGHPGGGYVAIGPAGAPPAPSATAIRPTGSVSLVPLDGPTSGGDSDSRARDGSSGPPGGTGRSRTPSRGPRSAAADPSAAPVPAPSGGSKSGRTGSGSSDRTPQPTPTPSPTPSPSAPVGPAVLTWGTPVREATDRRWCEAVTLAIHNTGGTAAGSGTVTLGTHIIGALGIDWATVRSTRPLPAPIAAGATRTKTWTVCVDAWRVPLGMHVETRDVSVTWS
ncbi:hypothetical protein [Streptomyces sp. NPDC005423]|uniref:hypothetical protein n=1 Tax=Streptomyces sp. NPDC005423 TaxID=3155343 RepID=UPI0033A9D9ED